MQKIKINNITIYDGMGKKTDNSCIVFNKNILAIGEEATKMEADIEIDGTQKVLLPGLIDCHCHISVDAGLDFSAQSAPDVKQSYCTVRAINNCKNYLKNGVTSTRSLGSKYDIDIDIRDMIDEGLIEGPNLVASGQPLTMTGGHGWLFSHEVDGTDEVKKYARLQIKKGANVIKVFASGGGTTKGVKPGAAQMSEEEMRAACIEAEKTGKTTAAHSQSVEGNKNAIRAGITSIEHGIGLDDEAIVLMKKHGTYLVATLAAPYGMVKYGKGKIPDWMLQKNIDAMEPLKQAFQLAMKNGIKIATGTDAGTPFNFHGDIVTEMNLMHEYGMSVNDIIIASTKTGAELLQIDNYTGTIEKGKLADLLIINGDPENDFESFRDIFKVYKSGKPVLNN